MLKRGIVVVVVQISVLIVASYSLLAVNVIVNRSCPMTRPSYICG